MADANAGIEMVGAHLAQATIDSKTYWFEPPAIDASETASTLHLLPRDALQAAGERYGLFLGVPVAAVVRE